MYHSNSLHQQAGRDQNLFPILFLVQEASCNQSCWLPRAGISASSSKCKFHVTQKLEMDGTLTLSRSVDAPCDCVSPKKLR